VHSQLPQSEIIRRTERHRASPHSGALARFTIGVPMKFRRSGTIYAQGDPVEHVYEVVRGGVRTVNILPDGRRQIGGFYFAGETFGLDDRNERSSSAEAMVNSEVWVVRRRTLINLARQNGELAEQLLAVTRREMARQQNHALMLVKTAEERLGSFLLELAGRISIGNSIDLPMSRQDIADHLGVTVETISRTFTALTSRSIIRLPNARAVILHDRSKLSREVHYD
jgi:CRP/FNR family transcriptional regulator, nitrogen fixation regulation protein